MKKGVNHWVKTLDDTASQTKSWYHDAYRPDSESPTQGTLPPGPSGNQTSLDVTLSMEAELSRRLQERNRSFVVPQILLNLELAAYYLLVLINVSQTIPNPVLRLKDGCFSFHLCSRPPTRPTKMARKG